MRNQILKILSVVILLQAAACEKEIDFSYIDIEPILVIEGALTQNEATVSLTLTTPMDEPMNREHLKDAQVSISDLTTGEKYILHPNSEGIYTSTLTGIEDRLYELEVERNGKYYSAKSKMGSLAEITSMEFSWIKMPYDQVAVLQVSFKDNPEHKDECYWVRLYRNGEAYKWAEIKDIYSSGGKIDKAFMTTRLDIEEEDEDDLLLDEDIISATVVPISANMYDYLGALGIGNSNGPQMFTGDFCLGYFLAAPISTSQITFYRP